MRDLADIVLLAVETVVFVLVAATLGLVPDEQNQREIGQFPAMKSIRWIWYLHQYCTGHYINQKRENLQIQKQNLSQYLLFHLQMTFVLSVALD